VSIEGIVQEAILQRRTLEFAYEGDAPPARVGHPHALFLGPKGDTCVEVLQVSGFTAAADLPAWHSFRIAKIEHAEHLDIPFEPDPGWDPLSDKYAGGVVAMV
jgi:hypothetical protein